MAQIDDLLEQAEAQDGVDSWVLITKYQRKEFYVDSDRAINVVGRKIEAIKEEVSVQGENHSQYIEFIMDRYYDGIDIAEQTLAIHYEVGDVSDEDAPINVYKNNTQIKFGWVVENNLTQYATTVEFCIWARGTLTDGNTYVLKTLPQKYEIQRGLTIAGGIIEPSTNWYTQFALNMDQKVAQTAENADRAEQAAASLDGVVETVTTARDEVVQKASTVNTQHSEVENLHQESEQFRNEAEQFRNEAFEATPSGYEELVGQVSENTDGIEEINSSIEAGFKKQAQGEAIHTTDAVDGKVVDFAMYGKSEQNTTTGKNLCEPRMATATANGVACTNNGDGTFSLSGTPSVKTTFRIDQSIFNVIDNLKSYSGEYSISMVKNKDSNAKALLMEYKDGNYVGLLDSATKPTATVNTDNAFIYVDCTANVDYTGVTFAVQLEKNSVVTEYEPYTGGIPSPNPNYPQEIETAGASGSIEVTSTNEDASKSTTSSIPIPNGLSGIKVPSGGNYTDENGQQWITDEIIRYADGSGEYVQKTLKKRVLSSLNWTYSTTTHRFWADDRVFEFGKVGSFYPNAICTHFSKMEQTDYDTDLAFSYINQITGGYAYRYLALNGSVDAWKTFLDENEVYVVGLLATPIHTPLTAEQISEIEKLSMFNPVTNISNDADCGMSVTYATVKEALVLQEAYNQSKENAQEIGNVKEEIVDVKQDLSDTTSRVESIEERASLGITETASGEEIHLIDSAEGKAVEFALYGKAKQNTTSGKQLIDIDSVVIGYQLPKPLEAGTYTVSFKTTSANGGFRMSNTTDTSTNFVSSLGDKNSNGYVVITLTTTFVTNYINLSSDGTVSEIMLAEGSEYVPYEPYTNGASPNPSYPQEIEVSGESYNLLENTATSKEINGGAITVNEDKSILVNGTFTSGTEFVLNSNFTLPKGKYIFSTFYNSAYGIYLSNINGVSAWVFGNVEGKEIEITSETNIRCGLYINSGATVDNVTFKPMIRKASVKNDRYMPYGKGSVEVKSCRKNLAKLEQGTLAHETDGGDLESDIRLRTSYVPIKPFTDYITSANNGLIIKNGVIYDKNKKRIVHGVYPNVTTGILNVTNSEARYIRLIYGKADNSVVNPNDYQYQFELGTVVTPYVEYQEPLITTATIPTENGLAGIKVTENGNYTDSNGQQWVCDEVVKYADGSGAFVQKIKKVVYDGSSDEGWLKVRTNENTYYVSLDDAVPLIRNTHPYGMCNRFRLGDGDYESGTFIKDDVLYFRNNDISTLEDWISWLTTNNVEFIYQLAEPITTPLTAEEIAEISTFYPITNISNDFDCGMSVKYVGEGIVTTNTKIPVVTQDGELESEDNIVTLFGKIKRMLENLNSRLSTLEQNSKTIVYSDTEPETVEENTIVMVYETEE